MITLTGNTQTTYDKILNKYFAYLNDSIRVNEDVAEIKTELNEFLKLHKDEMDYADGFAGWNVVTERYQFVTYYDEDHWKFERYHTHIDAAESPLMFNISLNSLIEIKSSDSKIDEIVDLIINQLNEVYNIFSLNNQLDSDHIKALTSATAHLSRLVINGNRVINSVNDRMLCLSLLNWIPNKYLKQLQFDEHQENVLNLHNFTTEDNIEKCLNDKIPNGQLRKSPFGNIVGYGDIASEHDTCQIMMQQIDVPLDDNIKNLNFRNINTDMILHENNDRSQFFDGMYSGLENEELSNYFARFSTLKMCVNNENYRRIRTNPDMTVEDVFTLLKNQWNL